MKTASVSNRKLRGTCRDVIVNVSRAIIEDEGIEHLNIRRIAEEHRVPVFESPKLARALHKYTDLNEEIPAGLYVAVAQVLSYIFKVRTLNPTAAARMAKPVPTVGDEYLDV